MNFDLVAFALVAGSLAGFGFARRDRYMLVIRERIARFFGLALAAMLLVGCAASPASVAFGSHAGRALRALCGIAPAILPTLDRMADAEVADPDAGTMPAAAALDAGVPAIGGE